MSDLDNLPGQLIELRQLITEAHACIADMRRVLRDLRRESADATARMRKDTERTASTLIAEMTAHLQDQQNQASADLNRAVDRARVTVIDSLTMTRLQPDKKGGYKVQWARGRFDDSVPLPAVPPGRGGSSPAAVIPPGLRKPGRGGQR